MYESFHGNYFFYFIGWKGHISNKALKAFRKETIEKFYKGLPSFAKITRTSTKK